MKREGGEMRRGREGRCEEGGRGDVKREGKTGGGEM